MDKIIECVPNFSEGSDINILDSIKAAITSVKGAYLLNMEPDADYNRAVFTFVGDKNSIVEAAFQATKTASELIDMRKHKGGHPRMGATDVVPFVPVKNASVEDCIDCSKSYAEKISKELNIPVFLYESSATRPERVNLANVRSGEYEGLANKLKDPQWKPDFGEAVFNPESGATITGARKFLIAYNVNIDSTDVSYAKEIAFRLRESGRIKKDSDGNKMYDDSGKAIRIPGKLKNVKGLGVALVEQGITQVSMNLTDFTTSGMELVYESCVKEAKELGVNVTGSEVVGLVPEDALVKAGRFYAQKSSLKDLNKEKLIDLAITSLGLSSLYEFKADKKIVEKIIANME